MKKYILGLMICMSVMGTTTSFGKTNKSVTKLRVNSPELLCKDKQGVKNSPRTEVVCNQKKSTTCSFDKTQDRLCKTCKELEKKQQPKKVQQKKQQTCSCSTCKKQNNKQQVKQTTKRQPVTWRNTCQQPVRK